MDWPNDFINKIICADCLSGMKDMPENCIDMVICSPPYWGLRDYGFEQIFGGEKNCEHDFGIIHRRAGDKSGPHGPGSILGPTKHAQHDVRMGEPTKTCSKCHAWKGQLGLEPTPELYIEHLTEIFNEVKRVLKKEGTLWLNIGDTYNSQPSGTLSGAFANRPSKQACFKERERRKENPLNYGNVQIKSLCMIPERLAWSLIQNGWILRNKNIWHKRNAMPSSVTDRFSNTYEFVYMFSKSQRYYFDLDAVREAHAESGIERMKYPVSDWRGASGKFSWCQTKDNPQKAILEYNPLGKNPGDVFEAGAETRTMGAIIGSGGGVKVPGGKGWTGHPEGGGAACQKDPRWCSPKGKNPGDFWDINTQPFPEAHFAVFPEKLCEKPIKAGCPEQICKRCGKARERIIETINARPDGGTRNVGDRKDGYTTKLPANPYAEKREIGWTSCPCNVGFEGGILLDPFCGAGTALYVAKQLRRKFIGIDIKQKYCDMAEKRLAQGVL